MKHGSQHDASQRKVAPPREDWRQRCREEVRVDNSDDGVWFDPGDEAIEPTLETEDFEYGRYELVDEIARGGAGVVYRAWDCQLQRYAALKVMLPGTWNSPARTERFLREARAAARLNDAGTVRVFDQGVTIEGAPWFAMELVEGPSMAQLIAEHGALPELQALDLTRQIAETLHRVHTDGLAHRDIKPGNILLNRAGVPLLTDFGLVIDVSEAELATAEGPVGTPAYMAPEQANTAANADWFRSDVYALGAVFFELLTGRAPPAFWHLRDAPLPAMGRAVSSDLEAICRKAMSYDPADRYASMSELLADLERFRRGLPVRAGGDSVVHNTWLFLRRHWPTIRTVLLTVATV
jgi:serine/threonine protein kinase